MLSRYSRFAPAAVTAATFVAISTAMRVLLSLRPDVAGPGAVTDWPRIFGIGLLFDVVFAVYLLAPVVFWLALVPGRFARTRLHRALTVAVFFAMTYGFVVLAVAEWLFWNEFGGRFNFIAVDYLLYTHEVIGNIWESYPVGRILLALLLPAGMLAWFFAPRLWRASGSPLSWRPAALALGAYAVLIAGTVQYVDSDIKNRFANDSSNDLAGDGPYEFFAANRRNELSYDRHYATLPLPQAIAAVRVAMKVAPGGWVGGNNGQGVERRVIAARPERHLNVVLVSMESLGAEFLGAYGNPHGLTPNLDRLARESLWFANVYATGNRTVRGLEALSLSLPPTPGQSIVRRPNNGNLFSLGSVFEDKGYGVLFAYGGYGYFDNMSAFFEANGYRSVDRRSIPSARIEFENIWGVADEHLFDQVLDEIDREKAAHPERPVFAHVMTTSNHRPYTYPPGRIDIASGSGRDGGVKYTDYAIGRFIEAARSKPWFDDTLFVITADHGASARGTSQIPLDKYAIPVLVYAPRHVAPRRVDRLMSQIDIAPTILGLLDFSYYTKFFGRDVLNSPPEADRAFVANYQTLGYMRNGRLVVLQPGRKVDVMRLAAAGPVSGNLAEAAIRDEAIAFYQTASYVFRTGLYGDEKQLPPENRVAAVAQAGRGVD